MRRLNLVLTAAIVLAACGAQEGPTRSVTGDAVVNMQDREWQIDGTCEMSDNHITFTAPGDPILTIGVHTGGATPPGGTFGAVSEGIAVIIGSPEVPTPVVEISGSSFEVSGTFLVIDATRVDGAIAVDCG